MKFAKRFLAALCLVLCVASVGWCIDPFKANKGGFGPKIKGIQLGMKMSLADLLSYRVLQERWPISLYVHSVSDVHPGLDERSEKGEFFIEFTGKGSELKRFEVEKATGQYAHLKGKGGKLGDLLAEVEKIGFEAIGCQSGDYRSNIKLNGDMRVYYMGFWKESDFGAGQMTPQEFAQAITDAYHIPGMDWNRQANRWEYRNVSEGWEINISYKYGTVEVYPIIVESKFD